MRVLFWSEMFWPYIGGAEVLAAKLLVALGNRGYEFIVVTRQDSRNLPREDRFKGIPVYRFPFCTALANGNIDQVMETRRQVTSLKRAFVPDLVHTNCFGPSVLFQLETARVHAAPFLITLHGESNLLAGPRSLMERTLRAADWVVGCSEAILDRGRQLVPEIASCSSVIHNGLELPPLLPTPLPFDAPRLLCLGRLQRVKGFDVALAAFSSIITRFPKARLLIAGDGPERAELERQTAELGLEAVVEFTGWVAPDAVPALINLAMVVVIPSRSESFPLVGLQAALMARPVVATRVGGLSELVVDRQTGLLVDPENATAIAEAIAILLDHPETATQIGQLARRRAVDTFSFEQHVAAYDALYRKTVADWRNRRLTQTSPRPVC